ncbi:hypothetical protein AB0M79_09505 [Polymorphospora sp. NPDC051019]|uniref:hypothetical protein n=1 Tax=Polymorphospora sp. NPDC051019 TaxID=3155725 RepID=UPI003430B772
MAGERLTMVETATLFILMAESGSMRNATLARDHGCRLEKQSREKLEQIKFIEVERTSGGRLVLTLSDRGWAYCSDELRADSAPPRAGAAGGALYAVLRRIGGFIAVQRSSLADFVATSTATEAPQAADLLETSASSVREYPPYVVQGQSSPQRPMAGLQDIEGRIRTAYRTLASSSGELVGLADLRDLVRDLPTADVDAALRRLNRQPGVALVPEANQKTLDTRTRVASVVVGDQPKHSISMETS